ncbi:MAG: alpha/beta hydrolase family protein [Anaerolineae bacterium]
MIAFFAEFSLALGVGQLAASLFRLRAISLVGPRWRWGYVAGLALLWSGASLLPPDVGALWLAPAASLLALIVLAGVASCVPPEPTPEVIFQPNPAPEFVCRAVSIPDGEYSGPGLLIHPDEPGDKAICLIHGSGCHKSYFLWRIVPAFLAQGLTVLSIDLPGHGDYRGRPLAYPNALSAIPAAIAFLKDQPGIKKVGLAGISLGGAFAARAVADGLAVDALAMVQVPIEVTLNQTLVRRETWATLRAPILDLLQETTFLKLRKMWLDGGYVGEHNVVDVLQRLDPLAAASKLGSTPTLLFYARRDAVARPAHAWALKQAAPHAEILLWPRLSHVTLVMHRAACACLARWLSERMPD